MYAIMGATGRTGGATARALLAAGQAVRVVVRDAEKGASWRARGATVAIAELADEAALASAFSGTDGVFVMVPPSFAPSPGFPEARADAATLRRALATARPPRIVLLSTVGAQHTEGIGILAQLRILEDELSGLGIPLTVLRPAWFLENIAFDLDGARRDGVIDAALTRPIRMVATKDIGTVAAAALQERWEGRRVIEIEGPSRVSAEDLAAALVTALGRPVVARALSRADWPAGRVEMLEGFNRGHIDFAGAPALHRSGPTTLAEVVAEILGSHPVDGGVVRTSSAIVLHTIAPGTKLAGD